MKGGGGKHITTISNFRLPFTPNRPAVKALKKKKVLMKWIFYEDESVSTLHI